MSDEAQPLFWWVEYEEGEYSDRVQETLGFFSDLDTAKSVVLRHAGKGIRPDMDKPNPEKFGAYVSKYTPFSEGHTEYTFDYHGASYNIMPIYNLDIAFDHNENRIWEE